MPASNETTAYPTVREAGLLESWHVIRGEVGFDSCLVNVAQYNNNGVLLSPQTLFPALRQVILAHPALSVQAAANPGPKARPRFVQLPEILLDGSVSFTEAEDGEHWMDDLIMAELARSIDLGTAHPLWRLKVVAGKTVVFSYHHAIGDGQSGNAFHASLAAALNSPSDVPHLQDNKVVFPAPTTMIPPTEALTDVSVSWTGFCSVLYNVFAPHSWTKAATTWTGNHVMQTPSVRMNVRCWEIEASQASELLTLCRKNGTTLTGFLHTLAVGALSKLVLDSDDQELRSKTLSTQVPVSLRPYTGVSPHAICDHVSAVRTYTPLTALEQASGPWFSWSAAAQFSKRLAAEAKSTREVIGTIGYLFSLGISKSHFIDGLGKKRQDSLELSNVGKFPGPPAGSADGPWRIGTVYWAQCQAVVGPAIKLNVVGSPTGAVNTTFSWAPGALEDDLAEALFRDMKANISSFLIS